MEPALPFDQIVQARPSAIPCAFADMCAVPPVGMVVSEQGSPPSVSELVPDAVPAVVPEVPVLVPAVVPEVPVVPVLEPDFVPAVVPEVPVVPVVLPEPVPVEEPVVPVLPEPV